MHGTKGWVGAGVLLASALLQAQASELPQRRAGMWIMTMELSARPGQTVTSEQCVDGKTDARMQSHGLQMNEQGNCRISRRKNGESYQMDSECRQGSTVVKSHSVIDGDFSSAYRMKTDVTYSPALMGKTHAQMRVSARYAGACKAGMQPGDIFMNGIKVGSLGGR